MAENCRKCYTPRQTFQETIILKVPVAIQITLNKFKLDEKIKL